MARKALTAQSDLILRHEIPYYPQLPKDISIFESGAQQLVMATVDGQDVMFWVAPYFLHGKTPVGFLADDAATVCTMFLAVPTNLRGKMNDTDFVCQGFTPADYGKSKDLKVSTTRDKAVWTFRDMEFVCQPPHWSAKGRHGNISFDLNIIGTSPTSFFIGDFKDILKTGVACFDQFTAARGAVTVNGKRYPIANGYGAHEHPVLARAVGEAFSHQMYWFIGGGDGLQFFHFTWGPVNYGRVLVDGKFVAADRGMSLAVTDWWKDPRSLATIPCRWHLTQRSKDGIFDVEAVAHGRVNRIWCLRSGYVLDVWIMGTANGHFIRPDGGATPVKDVLFTVEWMRTIWP
ncbi:MAG: hypothetical protein HYX97_02610 [Chloroflexi bacterium]|nr:hypothetical protein [Chloroflexota bacterium]